MRIVDARWEEGGNVLTIECDCGYRFEHPATWWRVNCSMCWAEEGIQEIRERYAEENRTEENDS